MWGDPDRAASLQGNDPLATLLFQISSPAHIPWGDPRWQELLHGYDVWVHMQDTELSAILNKACQSMARHAVVSSNLAALSLHVTRMLRQLVQDIQTTSSSQNSKSTDPATMTADFSKRISRVGKARATAGSLQLLRLLCHHVVKVQSQETNSSCRSPLEEALLYHTRGDLPCDQPAGRPLLHSILDLIAVSGIEDCDALETAEVYDAVVLSFHLLFVLCGTQLYQPFVSSFQASPGDFHMHYILAQLLEDDSSTHESVEEKNYQLFYASSRSSMSQTSFRDSPRRRHHAWTPQSILAACLGWKIRRPAAPKGSIAHYYNAMAQAAVAAKGGETTGPDGMYESHLLVQAVSPARRNASPDTDISKASISGGASREISPRLRGSQTMFLDATKGVFVIGSSIILLPFRLMSLVYGVITSQQRYHYSRDTIGARKLQAGLKSRTRDVLWLSDCPLADLGSCLVLLLVNNNRNQPNDFRKQLAGLVDNRWEHNDALAQGLPDLPRTDDVRDDDSLSLEDVNEDSGLNENLAALKSGSGTMTINFENLFEAFGQSLHTEVGALMLYTLFQTSPNFAESLAVRSDLDTLVMPLLRTLYVSSNTKTYIAADFASRKNQDQSAGQLHIRNCPFRSQAQLYVIIILLLLFSQDSSFGRDAFRRITVNRVLWYKERNLRNINLGSVLVLTLLRSLMFNLQRLQDAFLLSNCCAILQNLSPSMVDLHEYAAMRLASVTVSVLKKHLKLHAVSDGESTKESQKTEEAEYMTTPLGMYEEVARTLLGILQHCLSTKNVDRNLHLVYALVYHQADLNRLLKEKKLYPSKLVDAIQSITQEASVIIQEEGARTATKALNALEDQIERLQKVVDKKRKKEHVDDFTFTYEEESDPEIFFVPYVWETIVCVVSSSSIEWKTDDIEVFNLLDPISDAAMVAVDEAPIETSQPGQFAKDVDGLV